MLYHSIAELIGDTPLLTLNKLTIPNNNKILAKCEFFNPAGGIKDRVALYMLRKFKDEGRLHADSVIVEATAGNTGLGIAIAAIEVGCKALLIVPHNFSIEKQILMRALGAEVINTPQEQGMQGAMQKAAELLESMPNAIAFGQFENLHNPQAHYLTTAKEIYADTQGKIDYFVCGAGSGGSFSGIARYLKEQDSRIKAVLADPLGSLIGGNKHDIKSRIEGIGNTFIPRTMDTSLIDKVYKISDEQAYAGLKLLARKEGVLVGISSGACIHACLELAKEVRDSTIVTIFADGFSRYFSREIL
ncbi:PLP-dependent cysteine synthase family protein [uncultured Helicobacter sp.]|uniref:PLP-dependent cysteine synthase family protein n=1 Tax=uncultured Helicobacter sp. TaxID=175537 RepID=UPI001C3AA218|nr:cysteine synthase family protein [Candidatus Helicobacter avicola]